MLRFRYWRKLEGKIGKRTKEREIERQKKEDVEGGLMFEGRDAVDGEDAFTQADGAEPPENGSE